MSPPGWQKFCPSPRPESSFRGVAPVAELVDALDSKSSSARSAGSIPARGTICPYGHSRGAAVQPPIPFAARHSPDRQASIVCAEAPVPRIGRQARKLRMTEVEQRLVVAGLHINVRLHFDAVVDDDIQPVA